MRKSTTGIILGSVATGIVGGLIAIKKCTEDKEKLTSREKVEFTFLDKMGVSAVLDNMSEAEIKTLATACATIKDFESKIRRQRIEEVTQAVKNTLYITYEDFREVLMNVYDSEEDLLNVPLSTLIDEYFIITGENPDVVGIDPYFGETDCIEPDADFNLEEHMNAPEDVKG